MAVIGTATMNIVPKFPGLSAAINNEMKKQTLGSSGAIAGEAYGKGFGGGLVRSGAVIGAFSAITNKAMASISSHLDGAISRFDTLNNYPRVMESLGFGAEAADASISKISDRLSNLPTTLDSMVSTVQGLSVITKDLDLATDAGLALNDMLLASGSSQELVASATEQFRQMLSNNKPEMEDWKSLMAAMPGQMDQLARSMLGPTATTNDLYAALGGGKNKAKFTMTDLLNKIIELDEQGGDGFKSFQEQAEIAAGGVQTSASNMGNAVTKGIAKVMDTLGQERIAGVFTDIKGGINNFFNFVSDGIAAAIPTLTSTLDDLKAFGGDITDTLGGVAKSVGPVFLDGLNLLRTSVKQLGPELISGIAGAVVAFKGLDKIPGLFDKITSKMSSVPVGLGRFVSSLSSGPVIAGIAGFTALLGTVGMLCATAVENQNNFTNSTKGLTEVVAQTRSLDSYNDIISGIGKSSAVTAMSTEELAASVSKHVDEMRTRNEAAQEEIGSLNAAQKVIEESIGKTDLSIEAQGRLEWALRTVNEAFGLSVSAADVMAGSYKDAEGNVRDLTQSINDLVQAKKNEIKMNALTDDLTTAYQDEKDAADTYVANKKSYESAKSQYDSAEAAGANGDYLDSLYNTMATAEDTMNKSKAILDSARSNIKSLEGEIGGVASATSESATGLDKWGQSVGSIFESTLRANGTNITALKDDLTFLGVNVEQLCGKREDELLKIADAYDGTAGSITGALEDLTIEFDTTASAASIMAEHISQAIQDMGAESSLTEYNLTLGDLSQAFADAGIAADTMVQLGADGFDALLSACQGNVDMMISAIQSYDSIQLMDKSSNIFVYGQQLSDAMGNIWTWNGQELVDKQGNVLINETMLTDSNGNLILWNDTEIKNKNGYARVTGNLQQAIDKLKEWNSITPKTQTLTTVNRTVNESSGGGEFIGPMPVAQNAAGGIRLHANGAIVTDATPLDIVGEDGAEAILPLTNRTYSQPFIDLLANDVVDKFKASGAGKKISQVFNVYTNDPERISNYIANRERRVLV